MVERGGHPLKGYWSLPGGLVETGESLDEAVRREVLEANKLSDAYMRPVAWRGAESIGVAPGRTEPHMAIAAWDWGKYYDERHAEKGIRLDIAPWRRPAPAPG